MKAHYREWLLEKLRSENMTPALLSRRSGLSMQRLTPILQGKASQPTADQIAGFGRAFGMEPTEIFHELGFWSDPGPSLPERLAEHYRQLGFIERKALLREAESLRKVRRDYTALLRQPPRPSESAREDRRVAEEEPDFEPLPQEPEAAYEPMPEEMRRQLGDQEPEG